ncbi:MAG TPA: radical SAM protein, partial [Bacteroidetes bacterium]|nr:radical SAM protein [Bacteroidota bacterium]
MITRILKKANLHFRPGKLHFGPEWIVLGVNNLCNMHCKMCDVGVGYDGSNFYHNLMAARPLNMPIDLIKRIFDETATYFPQAKIGYAFTEPIIYPHLLESLAYANEKGLYTSMTTNALKLRKMASELAEAGLNDIFISLDGPQDIHNEIRGNKNSFQWAVEGIKKILALPGKRPQISVYCTITEWNIGHLLPFVEFFKDIPLAQMGFMHTNYTPQNLADRHNAIYGGQYPATASNMEEIDLDAMNLDLLWQEMEAIRSREWPFEIVFSPELPDKAALKRFYLQPEEILGKVCNDAFRTLMVKSDGSVIPAHGRCYNLTVGNIYKDNLKEIWNAPL